MDVNKIREIANNFEFEGEIKSIEELTFGHINENYLVSTPQKKYVLRKINPQVFKNAEAICFNTMIISSHISENFAKYGISNPQKEILNFVPSKYGELCFQNGETFWQATVYLENSVTYETVENTEIAYSAAKTFGKFQRILNDLNAEFLAYPIENFHNLSFRIGQYYQALEEDKAGRANEVAAEIELVEAHSLLTDRYDELIFEGLPLRVTHNDTKISNILFDKHTNQPLCVIDYDTIMPSNVLCDFGDMIRSYANSAAEDEKDLEKVFFRLEYFKSVAEGYLSELKNELKEMEIMNLVFGAEMIIYEQAVRFLTDYLNGDVYYRIKYLEHNLVRARNQFKLLNSLIENEFAAEEIIAEIIDL